MLLVKSGINIYKKKNNEMDKFHKSKTDMKLFSFGFSNK